MKKIPRLLALLLVALAAANGLGQTPKPPKIKRQVIASTGFVHVPVGNTSPAVTLTAVTVGQPPNAGTIRDGINLKLRQGYQQPRPDPCKVKPTFTVAETSLLGCGVYYQFEFTGDIDTATTLSWNFGTNAVPMFFDGVVPPLIGFTKLGTQEVTLTVSNGQCQKSSTQMVVANGTPFLATADKIDALCFGDKGSITLSVQQGTAPFAFKWSNGATTKNVAKLNPGNYAYTVTDSKGCVYKSDEDILGPTAPTFISAHVLFELCENTKDGSIEISLTNAVDPVQFLWSDGTLGPKRDTLSAGDYTVKITDANGCNRDTTFKIKVFCDLTEDEFIPDVFSPNGDGLNDVWEIDMLDRFPNSTVQLFNRWGNLTWEAPKGNFMSWDGRNLDGEEVPIGAYFYVIALHDATDKVFKGSVTIIR